MNQVSRPVASIILYGAAISGHCHRVALFMSLAQLPYQFVPVDLHSGEQKRPDFLKMNRFGQVPVIDDAGVIVSDSNAILVYLATRYAPASWYPHEPLQMARIQRWLSVAAGPLAFGAAMARAIALFRPNENASDAITRANHLFAVMNQELEQSHFLAGDSPTIADIAMYSYTARAPEGHISLEPFANVRTWLQRIESLPGFIAMPETPNRQA